MFSLARYNLGLSNVFDKDKYDGNNKNRVFQLSVDIGSVDCSRIK